MRVRLSSEARAYIRLETQYLRVRSLGAAERFKTIVQRARRLISDFPSSGITESAIPLIGAHRANIDGYLFDYQRVGDDIWVLAVRSSVNTPIIEVEDDRDYEG